MPCAEDLLEHRAWLPANAGRFRRWRNPLSQSEAGVVESSATIEGVVMYRVAYASDKSFICDLKLRDQIVLLSDS
jgi:hypothetical protein